MLVQLLMAVGIIGIIVAMTTQFYAGTSAGTATTTALATLQLQLASTLQNVDADIRSASSELGFPCTTLNIMNPTGTLIVANQPTTLCLMVPSLDAQGNTLLDANGDAMYGDVIAYSYNAGRLNRIVIPNAVGANSQRQASASTVASSLAPFYLSGHPANGVLFQRTISGTTLVEVRTMLNGSVVERGRTYTLSLSSRARLRNATLP